MNITKNLVKNILFDFVVKEYHNKVKYGQPPTPLVHFYNNWLISSFVELGCLPFEDTPEKTRALYEDKYLDITWQAVEDLLRDRIIKRSLLSGDDLLHWDLYVPTEKGLEIWDKYGKLLIIPSNLVDSLRNEIPEITGDADMALDYINEAVNCYFHGMHISCCLCLTSAGDRAVRAFVKSFCRLVNDSQWVRRVGTSRDILQIIDILKEKFNNMITHGGLLKDYFMVYPHPDENIREDLESYFRSLDLLVNIIRLTRNEDGSPSLAICKIEETFREDLVLGYLVGSYTFFRLNFVIKEIIDNISDFREKE